MLHHKYEVTIQFTTDRTLTEHERNCLMSDTVAQVDEPTVYTDNGDANDAEYRTWVKSVDLAWTGFIRRDPSRSFSVENSHVCEESDWRFLDCDKCEECYIRICVDCGAEVGTEPTPTCDVCAQPCDEEQREWCGTCGNCANHCASEMDCAGVTA